MLLLFWFDVGISFCFASIVSHHWSYWGFEPVYKLLGYLSDPLKHLQMVLRNNQFNYWKNQGDKDLPEILYYS